MPLSAASTPRSAAEADPFSRFPAFDAGRFIAAAGVVWIHACIGVALPFHREAGFIGRFAVPFFALTVVLFVAFSAWRRVGRGFGEYAFGRLWRIGLPFAAWTVIYLVLKAATGRPWSLDWSTLWLGGSYQLWFLPFALALSLLAFPAACAAAGGRVATRAWGIGAAIAGLCIALVPWAWTSRAEDHGLDLWIDALPAALWGLALACAWRLDGWSSLRRIHWAWGLLLLVVALASTSFTNSWRLPYNLAGLGLALAAISVPQAGFVARLAPLGAVAFGIYLGHVLFLGPLRSFGARRGVDGSLWYAAVEAVVALLLSLALALALRRVRALRWLVM